MNTDKKILKSLTKGDIILTAVLIIICLLWFFSSFMQKDEPMLLTVYENGEQVLNVRLDSLEEGETYQVGGCRIYADGQGVSFVSSCCEDKLCIKRGKMKTAGDTMACVPEKVVVKLCGESEADAVAY